MATSPSPDPPERLASGPVIVSSTDVRPRSSSSSLAASASASPSPAPVPATLFTPIPPPPPLAATPMPQIAQPTHQQQSMADNAMHTVAVANLPYFVRWQELKDLVKTVVPAAAIVCAEVYTDETDGKRRSRGVGSISLRDRTAALACFTFLDGYQWHDRVVHATLLSPQLHAMQAGGAAAAHPQILQQAMIAAAAAAQQSPMLSSQQLQQQQQQQQQQPMYYYYYYPPSRPQQTPSGQMPSQPQMPMQYHPLPSPPPSSSASSSSAPLHYQHSQMSQQDGESQQVLDPCKVFFGNIPFTTQWAELKDYIVSAANVLRVDIVSNHEGHSRGFAIALFATEEDAARAIAAFDGAEFSGRVLTVRLDRYPDSQHRPYAGAMTGSSTSSSGGSSPSSRSYALGSSLSSQLHNNSASSSSGSHSNYNPGHRNYHSHNSHSKKYHGGGYKRDYGLPQVPSQLQQAQQMYSQQSQTPLGALYAPYMSPFLQYSQSFAPVAYYSTRGQPPGGAMAPMPMHPSMPLGTAHMPVMPPGGVWPPQPPQPPAQAAVASSSGPGSERSTPPLMQSGGVASSQEQPSV
ncbi:uncharacterized protein V1518DRAFT_413920 [Limtongia smithiae]|uniref:uncharacterized protein n=1 Tax=Limtongia smithiae TaxID=1125753 RepID=UPI0034D01BDB